MNESLLIKGGSVVKQDEIEEMDILIKSRTVKKIEKELPRSKESARTIDVSGLYVASGLIDLQANGAVGHNFVEVTQRKELYKMGEFFSAHGSTALLATLISGSIDRIRQSMEAIDNIKNMWGIHLEGPFISSSKKGAHSVEHIISPRVKEFKKLAGKYEKRIKIVTYAPELADSIKILQEIKEIGAIPSIGHSNATYEQAMSALNRGAKSFTHLYNAMSGFHHRKPGCVGAALDSDAYVGLICDGLHVHPAAIRLALKAKGIDKICLVTDAISAAGMGDGEYSLGDQAVVVKEGVARLPDGTLAGSTLTMNQAVKKFMEFTGVSLPEAVQAASLNPARLLGIDDRKGSIEEGKDADLVIFDQDFKVHYTIIGGEVVYRRED